MSGRAMSYVAYKETILEHIFKMQFKVQLGKYIIDFDAKNCLRYKGSTECSNPCYF